MVPPCTFRTYGSSPLLMRPEALSRWDNEGGAGPDGPQKPSRFAKEIGNVEIIGGNKAMRLQNSA